MRKLTVFNNVSLDGYFTDAHGDMRWAHKSDDEWIDFTNANAGQGGMMLFGRITYQQMASYWPTDAAAAAMPEVASAMNAAPKIVFSTTLSEAPWHNTRLVKSGMLDAVRALKQESGPDIVVMGSGTVVAQLAGAGLVDEFQLVLNPLGLGAGRTLFEGIDERISLQLMSEQRFANGNVVLRYRKGDPVA